jgi:hypothetical protein
MVENGAPWFGGGYGHRLFGKRKLIEPVPRAAGEIGDLNGHRLMV